MNKKRKAEQVALQARASRLDGLTAGEGRVMDLLVAAVNAYAELPAGHPDEAADFTRNIHNLQRLLAGRAMARLFPDRWRGAAPEDDP